MGSQIIIEFISNMSTDILGKEIQNEIKNFVSIWDSDDKVNPKIRTSFLLSILEETETLKFPLPAVIDIDLYSSLKKSALERFFSMDGQCVRTINLCLGPKNCLNVLRNTKIDSLDALNIENAWGSDTFSRENNEDLCGVVKKVKPGLLSITGYDWKSINKVTIDVILQHVHTLILKYCNVEQEQLLSIIRTKHDLKVLKVNGFFYLRIDGEMTEALSKLSSDIKLDISSKSITLIHRSPNMKCLNGVDIDTEVAEAVSRLPDDIQLDLSGNKLTKMDPRLLPGVLLHMPQDKEINMTECGITIDVDIIRALSIMPQLKSLKGSFNTLTPEAAREFSMSQLQQLELFKCGINDTICVSLMIRLSKHCPLLKALNLSFNNLTSDQWCRHVQMKQLIELCLSNCGIADTLCVSLMISLSKHCPLLEVLNLSNNYSQYNNSLTSDEWCRHVQMKQLRVLHLFNCGICDTVYVSLMISLSNHCPLLEVLILSHNCLSSSGVWEIVDHIKHMKNLRVLWLSGNPCMNDLQCSFKLQITLHISNPGLEVFTGCWF